MITQHIVAHISQVERKVYPFLLSLFFNNLKTWSMASQYNTPPTLAAQRRASISQQYEKLFFLQFERLKLLNFFGENIKSSVRAEREKL